MIPKFDREKLVWVPSAVALGCALAVVACSNDMSRPSLDAAEGGPAGGGAGSGAGGRAQGGAAGSSSAGGSATSSGGAGGASGSTGETGGTGTGGATGSSGAGNDGGTPDGGTPDASGSGPALPRFDAGTLSGVFYVGGTDFQTRTEFAAIDLATRAVSHRETFDDGDVVVRVSGGRAFALERDNGTVDELDGSGHVQRRISLDQTDAGSRHGNPHDVVVVPKEGGGHKAYVSLYDENAIAIVDLDAGTTTGKIDLSPLHDASDKDGAVDVEYGFYDAVGHRAYFTAARIDITTINKDTNYELACPPVPSLLVPIDTETDRVVGLGANADAGAPSGADAGTGADAAASDGGSAIRAAVALGVVAPTDLAFDAAKRRAYVLASGCFAESGHRSSHGIEIVDLATGVTTTPFAPADQDYLNRLVLLPDGSALVQSFDAASIERWHAWQPGSASLGDLLPNVPSAAIPIANDLLAGVDTSGSPYVVAAYRISTPGLLPLVPSPFQGTVYGTANAALLP
jgi:hypothetical protein